MPRTALSAIAQATFPLLVPFEFRGDIRTERSFTKYVAHDPVLLTRDSRTVERNKYGKAEGPSQLPDLEALNKLSVLRTKWGGPATGRPISFGPARGQSRTLSAMVANIILIAGNNIDRISIYLQRLR